MLRAAALIHSQPRRIFEQRANGIHQPDIVQLGFFQNHGRAGLLQGLGIQPLMIIGGSGKRNENGRLSLRPQFPPPCSLLSGTRPNRRGQKKQACRSMKGETSADAQCALVSGLHLIIVTLAGLMDDVDARGLPAVSSGKDCIIA